MDKKYSEYAEVVDVASLDIQGITATVTINVKKYKVKCFVSDFKEKGPFSLGERCLIKLSLMTWPGSLNKIKEKKKEVKSEQRKGTPNHCLLSGEIVGFSPIVKSYYDATKGTYYTEENADYKAGIVDCGIFVMVEVPKDSDLKVGDYIKAEGRLDIRKVKQ